MGRALTITASPWWLFVTLASTIVALAPVVSSGSVTHYPDADVAVSWNAAGNNYSHIDEVGEPTTDSVYATVITKKDVYRVAITTAVPDDSIVDSVVLFVRGRKTGGMFAGEIKLLLMDSTTTTYDYSAVVALTTTAANYTKSWATNPFTAAAWTVADANATRYRVGMIHDIDDGTPISIYQLNKVVYYHAETPAAGAPTQSVIGGVD